MCRIVEWKILMFTHRLTSVAVKDFPVGGGLVSAIIISLYVYEIVSNSIKLNKKVQLPLWVGGYNFFTFCRI